jgi:hypothetical protein
MLSIFDLLRAETLDLDLAAYLMARISRGSSFMVGAVPGGAGKTTVMCALLNLGPADLALIAAAPKAVDRAAAEPSPDRACYICHEISPGDYFAYLWGDELRAYCGLADRGHMLAANLHADDLVEARNQVCRDNAVPAGQFSHFGILIFLRVAGGGHDARRRIEKVYSRNETGGHVLVHDASTNRRVNAETDVAPTYLQACRAFLEDGLRRNVRTIEETRGRLTAFLARHPPARA